MGKMQQIMGTVRYKGLEGNKAREIRANET